jgi:hypothetical protein
MAHTRRKADPHKGKPSERLALVEVPERLKGPLEGLDGPQGSRMFERSNFQTSPARVTEAAIRSNVEGIVSETSTQSRDASYTTRK